MMGEQKFREGINEVSEVLRVFIAAKKNKGQRFIDEIIKLYSDPDNSSKFQKLYEYYKHSNSPVNNVRKKLLEKLMETGKFSIDDLNDFQSEEREKYDKDVFQSRTPFSILYTLYYFYDDRKSSILKILNDLNVSLMNDAGIDEKHAEQAFDYNNHFGIDDFYIGFFNKTHDSRVTAKQFRIQSKGNNKLLVGLYSNKTFIKGKYTEYEIDKITYQNLLDESLKYKDEILNDKWVNLIDYIKNNIDKYKDIKEKAQQERETFKEKFPLENLKNLTLEEYNTGMGNANNGTFTWYLNTDYAISGWLFSNGQNWLFYKGEDGKYQIVKNMKEYLDKGNGDLNAAFQIYKDDLYNFVKNFDVKTYNPDKFLSGAKYIKAALILLYKGDIFLTIGLVEVCIAIAKHLNLTQGAPINPRKVDIIEYDLMITDYLKKEIPDIIDKHGYSALGKCVYDYYTNYLSEYLYPKNEGNNTEIGNYTNYYAAGADLGYGDKQDEFYSRGKLIIGWYEIGDLSQFETEEELVQKFKKCKFSDTESHFKQTFTTFKQIKAGDIVCVKSVHLQKKEMYIYAVGEVLQGYDNGYEYLDGLGHSLPVKWKILDEKYTINGAKYQKTLTKIQDDEIKHLLDKLLGNSSNNSLSLNTTTMVDLNTILYGVPGTGKTYNTVNYAVSIIENKSIEEVQKEERDEIKKRYENYVKEGQIVFTTFHQSFGYEDFVEGIKASVENGAVNYSVEDGIFKKLCKISFKNYEDSKKDLSELSDEYDINTKVDNFLSKAIEDNTTFKLNRGGKFVVADFKDDTIIINNPGNEKWGTIRLNVNRLLSLLKSNQSFKTPGEVAEFLHGGHNWQENSYYYILYSDIKKIGGKKTESITEKVNLKNYVLIVDEINRGNISKIFGELITLLEQDKRLGGKEELKVKLPYSHEEFGVPDNLYVLGTMNTADRSIALIDLALRRRFKFKEIEPNPELLSDIPDISGINVKDFFETVNKRIEFLYDRDHLLGHAYFLPLRKEATLEKLNSIILDKIVPLLQEYFHDDWEKIQLVLGDGIVKSEMVSAKDLGINSSEYEEQPKYYINTTLSAQDYPH